MTKQVRISDRAAEYLTEQMKRNNRRFIADELDTILFSKNPFYSNTYTATAALSPQPRRKQADSTAAKPSKDQAK